jgi:hypothetical protein
LPPIQTISTDPVTFGTFVNALALAARKSAEDHTINAGCPTHFQDYDLHGDLDLILHFDVAALFPYATDAIPTDPIPVTLTVTFVDESVFTAAYVVQLVYNTPSRKGKQGRRP